MTTILEIAAQAGVSVSAASRVLSYDPSLTIEADLRRRLFEIAAAPPMAAPSARSQDKAVPRRIGLLCPMAKNGAASDICPRAVRMGVVRECERQAIECVELSDRLSFGKLDGIIAVGRYTLDEIANWAPETGPIVFAGASPNELLYDSVVIDYRKALDELIDRHTTLGYRRFAYVCAGESTPLAVTGDARLAVLERRLSDYGLGQPIVLAIGDAAEDAGSRLIAAVRRLSSPTVVLIGNASLASSAAKAVEESKHRGQYGAQDFQLVAMADFSAGSDMRHPYAVLQAPMSFMGETAVRMLLNRTKRKASLPQKTVLQSVLLG